jgi:hypothetical protein
MGKGQRKEHMRIVVLPQAEALFGGWRPERFAKIDCTLCHGQGTKKETSRCQPGTFRGLAEKLSWDPILRSIPTPPG